MNAKDIRKAQGKRLAAARRLAGFKSARDAALSNGWKESTYRAHEGGTRTIGQDDAERYARKFRAMGIDVSAQSILFEGKKKALSLEGQSKPFVDKIQPLDPASVTIQIRGFVQGGNWVENPEWPHDEWQEIKITPVAEYLGITLYACRVRGNSMNKLYPDGTILVWVNIHETMETPISGRRYIVQRSRHDGAEYEMTVKTYLERDGARWLLAESDDPEFQGAIKLNESEDDHVEIVGRVVRSIREE